MTSFIHEDFILKTESAKVLYHDYAKDMPIYDYHCHLSPKEIAENHRFNNLTEIWLHGDHYKWRAMRTLGIDEKFITGDASDEEKFKTWVKAVPYTVGNPLYHWTHLELKRYFDVDALLSEKTADDIWKQCNEKLQTMTTQDIIKKSGVKVICTTDDPVDNLEHHHAIKDNPAIEAQVLPTFRPDKALEVQRESFKGYVDQLLKVAGEESVTYDALLSALEKRMVFFHEAGCRLSDHGIETLPYVDCSLEEASSIFEKAMLGHNISLEEEEKYKTYTLLFLGRKYREFGWVMQLHIGAVRNNNERMFDKLGPDTGFDSIHDFDLAKPLNRLMNELEKSDVLPKTIIYTLNPNHNYTIASAIGNFQSSETRGKIQFGSGWWFNDQKDGMIRQMTDLASVGLLSTFVGMLTDSRSFLSYTRHEYFRRILCNIVGGWMENGEVPKDYEMLGKIVQDISYNNAVKYFDIEV
ncbi:MULTISPECIES: glucuronate isomerase [Bacillaceae]|uniref:Uronate isomerase n=1 Tax=Evansella alkalicola TaxID=745819 RepID=A0ABS6JZQ8_9BACI|nr:MULTISPECIES: glucuronate isomerase [Bacillaceae]MBU9723571.1 glucuronate isomerase [Bacillus alkalicola]